MARTESLTVAGGAMEVYVDEPAGAGPHPAMVVAHHRGALDAFTKKYVEDLASAGYAAAAPALFHRRPAGGRGICPRLRLRPPGRAGHSASAPLQFPRISHRLRDGGG